MSQNFSPMKILKNNIFAVKSLIHDHLYNYKGWKTNRKIIVFESDDWGSIRTSGKYALDDFRKKGLPIEYDAYTMLDSLESNDDIEFLLNLLASFKTESGNEIKFTINNIVANPDFNAIKDNNFENYYFEYFTDTLNSYSDSDNVMEKYRNGIKENLLSIQFHGREHLHIKNWMNKLQSKNPLSLLAFQHNMFTYYPEINANCTAQNLDSFGYHFQSDFNDIPSLINNGLNIFEEIWGFKSRTIVCPCHIWNPELNSYFKLFNINQIQSGFKQMVPILNENYKNKIRHYTGEKSKEGILFTVRNVNFEPAIDSNDAIERAIKQIETAFFWNTPAIVSTHRLNYISRLDIKNRDNNLKKLEQLLSKLIKKWPSLEVLTSDELGHVMTNEIG